MILARPKLVARVLMIATLLGVSTDLLAYSRQPRMPRHHTCCSATTRMHRAGSHPIRDAYPRHRPTRQVAPLKPRPLPKVSGE